MASTSLSIKYRPIQIGFLVRDGFLEDLAKAASLNTILWGGVRNPIIPVKSGNVAAAEKLIQLYTIDVLYPVAQSIEIQELIKKYPFLRDPGHYAQDIFYEDWHTKKKVLGYLDSKNIVDYYWEKEFKYKSKDYKSSFILPKWEQDDPLAHTFEILFGKFPQVSELNLKYNYEEAFVKGLMASDFVIPQKNGQITFNPFDKYAPLITTGFELSAYSRYSRYQGPGIYIGKALDFEDLINFWNLRASGLNIWYYAIDFPERTSLAAKQFISSLDSLPNRNPKLEDYLSIYYRVEDEQVKKIVEGELKTSKRVIFFHLSEQLWDGLDIQHSKFVFDWQHTTGDMDKSFGRESVNIQLPQKKFFGENEDNIDVRHQQLAIIIDSFSDLNHSGSTLKPPFLPELNEFYSREMAVDPWRLRSDEDGISYLTRADDITITLYPISYKTLIEKLFEIKGLKIKTSQAGLLTNKIINKLGDLEDGRVLKILGVRKLLGGKRVEVQNTTNPTTGERERITNYIKASSVEKKEALQTIGAEGFDKHKKLFIEQRDAPELTTDHVFNYLLKRDVFRAGLEITCEECKLRSWLSLTRLDNSWICEYCGASNQTALQIMTPQGNWRFRKSGLFAKDNNQEGAIPVILALLTLKRVLESSGYPYTTSLKIDGNGVDCESDLCIMQYNKSDGIELAVGECKNEGGIISEEDCNNMVAVVKALSVGGQISPHIIFAKTADKFTSEEINRFKKLRSDGYSLILLTNREMEPYHMYWENEGGGIDGDIIEKYPHSFNELCQNSIARYLQ